MNTTMMMLPYSIMATAAMLLLLLDVVVVVDAKRYYRPKYKPEDYHVQNLEQVEPAFKHFDGQMYAGLVPTKLITTEDVDDGELMFWLFLHDAPKYDDTLVIWLNGGPGCSSLSGNMFENGPVTIPRKAAGFYGIDETAGLEYNPYTWANTTAIMYVEQPHGTGFSRGTFPVNETEVGRDFYKFLQNLFTIFDGTGRTDLRTKKLTFFGESYAGMYVPSIAHYIHEENKKNNQLPKINLVGIALGNGWMDATVQGPAVIDYAWWHGMIDSSNARALKQEWENCKDGSDQSEPFHAFTVPDECGIMGALLTAAGAGAVEWGAPNAYDVTTWDKYLMLDSHDGGIYKFYNNPDVQTALNVDPQRTWTACMPGAGRRRLADEEELPGKILLAHDQPVSVIPYVADLLDDAKIRVLIYNGDRDLTTNSVGSETLLDNMDWSGQLGWADADQFDRGLWIPMEKTLGGYIKSYKNLQFLVVSNSGHLVPYNEDKQALDLATRFLGEKSFMDVELQNFKIPPKKGSKTETKQSLSSTAQDVQPVQSKLGDSKIQHHRKHPGIWVVLALAVGFLLGFFISRRFQRKRDGYEMVPNYHGLNSTNSD